MTWLCSAAALATWQHLNAAGTMHQCMLTAGLQMASQKPTFSSSQMVLHLSCMHLMRRLFPSEICTLKCPRQQSLQKKCPHSMAETSASSQQQKQHWQSMGPDGSDALLPAHGKRGLERPAIHWAIAAAS